MSGSGGGGPEQACAGVFEGGVVLGGGPGKVKGFDMGLQFPMISFPGPDPKPGQEGVHGQVGGAAFSQERLWLGQGLGGPIPVMSPEGIGSGLEEVP